MLRTRNRICTWTVTSGLWAVFTALPLTTAGESVTLNPSKDNTIYENEAALSNGSGQFLFAGRNGLLIAQRGLLAFDIAGNLPAGATVTGVKLEMNMSRAPSASSANVSLHKLLSDWGEGSSVGSMGEGGGGPAASGDATWLHTFYDTLFWTTPGGDFSAVPSATQAVGPIGGYTWSSTVQLVADVQGWLDAPETNFGWLLMGDESGGANSKRFDSRNNFIASLRPKLTIDFVADGTPPMLTLAVSRRTHGAVGPFDIVLDDQPVNTAGIECRVGGVTQLVLTFSEPIVAADGTLDDSEIALSGGALAGASIADDELFIDLTDVPDRSCLTVTLSGLEDGSGNPLAGRNTVHVRVLSADVNADGQVASGDITQVKARSGQITNPGNFRADTNADGQIASGDITQVKSRSGTSVICP
ncbi:MAG: hypothetical protein AMXMBFR13_30310 [Phycisphaerae bacterium]